MRGIENNGHIHGTIDTNKDFTCSCGEYGQSVNCNIIKTPGELHDGFAGCPKCNSMVELWNNTIPRKVRIQYNKGEVGWATPITNELMIIENAPLNFAASKSSLFLHHGDIVEVEEDESGFSVVRKIIKRQFPVQEGIFCTKNQFRLLAPLVRYLKGYIEGGGSGSETEVETFLAIVALPNKNHDPIKLAEAIGICNKRSSDETKKD